MKPYNNGTKTLKGESGMISVNPYVCSDRDIARLRDNGVSLYLTRDLLNSCDDYLCPIVQDGKIGFINSFAELVIPAKYDKLIGRFVDSDSLIVCVRDGKCGLLNTAGLEILMGEYRSVEPIDNQYAIVMNSEYRKGIVEVMTNRITVPFGEYHNFIYNDNVLVARINFSKGLITPTGKKITPIKYRWISGVECGLLRVIVEDAVDGVVSKRWGLINTSGVEILPVIYDQISPIKGDGTIVYATHEKRSVKFDISNLTLRD